jgi:hypothetical protein
MSTITSDPRASVARQQRIAALADPPADQRITIRGLPWELYDTLSEAIAVRQKVYLAYDGKNLEIMVKGRLHEQIKDMFGKLITAITDDLRIDCRAAGETTWKRQADEVQRWILEENADDPPAWRDRLRTWNQNVLSPRMAK